MAVLATGGFEESELTEPVRAHLKIDRSVVANIPTRKTPVVPA